MNDDMFTYKVEIPGISNIPCDMKERIDRMEEAIKNKCNDVCESFMGSLNYFNDDTSLTRGFDEFCKRWWEKKQDGGTSDNG
ncbi:hypothetical protein Tco_1122839 [Tanacetum coccineum]|uniref:Uncharacterized protein n=1 Tax=Tanacetum coccineum TaxID=301880 RepID=A0ABQ5J1U4_9ASTR